MTAPFSLSLQALIRRRWFYGIAVALGLLQAVAFDFAFDAPIRWLAPFCSLLSLGGYLSLVVYLTPKRAMLFGYCFGLGIFAWGLNWIYISMAQFGGAPLAFAIVANATVVAYLALYWLLASYLIVKLGKTRNQRLLLAAPIIALLEWVRSVFLIGFPWLSLGYAWVDFPLGQLAAWGGVLFVSFALVLCLALLLLDLPRRYRGVTILCACTLGVAAPHVLNKQSTNTLSDKTTHIALVQGNMPVITEYSQQRMQKNLVRYQSLTEEMLNNTAPDVVIWAESAIPYLYVEALDFLGEIYQLQQRHHFDLITGVPHVNWDNNAVYNSVLLQTEQNPAPQFYSKYNLLAFGEYLPFRTVLAFFKDFVKIPMSDFSRGDIVQSAFEAGGVTFAPSICFEAVFGDTIRQNALNAEVLLNISNDAWFGRSKAQLQHLNIARMRAIENRKTLVRATNDGLTAIVSASGAVEKAIPPYQAGTLTATISGSSETTFYARFGDAPWLIVFALWGLSVLLFYRVESRKRPSDKRIT